MNKAKGEGADSRLRAPSMLLSGDTRWFGDSAGCCLTAGWFPPGDLWFVSSATRRIMTHWWQCWWMNQVVVCVCVWVCECVCVCVFVCMLSSVKKHMTIQNHSDILRAPLDVQKASPPYFWMNTKINSGRVQEDVHCWCPSTNWCYQWDRHNSKLKLR